jgi:uncharacterized protein (TIGR00730 family)
MRSMACICVFCGSSEGRRPAYLAVARRVGSALARRGVGLVYGKVGLMGALADATLAAGGEVIGVIPEFLEAREIAHRGLTELRAVRSMHDRKAEMADLSDAFLVLPGGFGTFEKFCEVLTWGQFGLHHKPLCLLNVERYYDSLLRMFDHAVAEGFLGPASRVLVQDGADPDALIDHLLAARSARLDKWSESQASVR